MDAQLRRALLAAPLAAVAAVGVVVVGIDLGLSIFGGEPMLGVLQLAFHIPLLVFLGVPTAYAVACLLVGAAFATQTSLAEVSLRAVAISATAVTVAAAYGLLWSVGNPGDWWLCLFTVPAGIVGAETFVRLRARAAAAG